MKIINNLSSYMTCLLYENNVISPTVQHLPLLINWLHLLFRSQKCQPHKQNIVYFKILSLNVSFLNFGNLRLINLCHFLFLLIALFSLHWKKALSSTRRNDTHRPYCLTCFSNIQYIVANVSLVKIVFNMYHLNNDSRLLGHF